MANTFAAEFKCKVLDVIWVTPSVVRIRFEPSKKFKFLPGQFMSVVIPPYFKGGKAVKRCYSFANSPEEAASSGYELCVKYVPGGIGSGFLGSLNPGDTFKAYAPYGDFLYRVPSPGRSVCFICTGTGVAPFRSAVASELFQSSPPEKAYCLQGVGSQREILYRGEFEALGVKTVYAVSRPDPSWTGFKGRVTDFLRKLPRDWQWHSTDFYICGSGAMVNDVGNILKNGFGVVPSAIFKENFAAPSLHPSAQPKPAPETTAGKLLPLRLPFPEAA